MLPESMKKPLWLVPVCIADITIGLFLLLAVTLPGFTPDLKEKAERRGLTGLLLAAAAINIAGPIGALWYHCRTSAHTGGSQ